MNSPLNLQNRHILVNGASSTSDIGVAICKLLSELGAKITLVGRNIETLEETRLGISRPEIHHAAVFDLNDVDNIPGWMKEIVGNSSPFDGMVHLASHQGYSPLKTVNKNLFDKYFNLNVAASIMLAKGFAQKGVANKPSSIVYMGSIAGLTGQKGRCLYAASKAALISVTETLAIELIPKKIRVNCIAPAVVLGNKAEIQFKMLPEQQKEELNVSHPMGYGKPEDVANAVAYFLTDATKWVTGTTLPLDGGYLLQ